MRRTVFTTLACILVIVSTDSCKKPPSTPPVYNMNFTLSAGAAPLLPGPGNVVTNTALRYYLNYVQFYIGYLRLEKADGTELPLTNLLLIEFNPDPPATPSLVFNNQFGFLIPPGSYTGIKFGIGIPDAILDTIKHNHYSVNDPLCEFYGMARPGEDSIYRNIAIDMLADTSIQQNQPVNREYDFHILEESPNSHTVNLYSEILFPDAFIISNGDVHTATFNLDFNNVIFNSANPVNLRTSVSTDMNTPVGIALGELINKNFYNSLTIK